MNTSRPRRNAALGATALFALVLAGCGRQETAQSPESVRDAAARNDAAVAVQPAEPNPQVPGTSGGLEVFRATGTINSVDRESGRIVIAHEEVTSAGMQQGETEFVARDKDPLALVKPGQRIDFSFTRLTEGGYQLTDISPTPPQE